MLRPLVEFICDSCGELIASPEVGWVEWLYDQRGAREFRICHHPARKEGDCSVHGDKARDGHLHWFVGPEGLVRLLRFISTQGESGNTLIGRVAEMEEFLVFFQRLQIPHYEEARRHFDEAYRDDGQIPEVRGGYAVADLRRIIRDYARESAA